jgi:hypothetical protein
MSASAQLQQNPDRLLNPRYNLEFSGSGRSAFIGDELFAAIDAVDENGGFHLGRVRKRILTPPTCNAIS